MTKASPAPKSPPPSKPAVTVAPAPVDTAGKPNGIRETLESIVIAFVLAFLFRTFEAEAFVIPTGSMATTLMGMHKDLHCEQCDFPYRVGVDERDPHLTQCTCPNCGFTMRFGAATDLAEPPTFKGDRIIVTKSIFDFEGPRRWDVSVFKYPMTAQTNYIKRIVGLPNETLRIWGGDVYTRPLPAKTDDRFEIERKPPEKVRAMLQVVYDNDYQSPWLRSIGWPERWTADGSGWQASTDNLTFQSDGQADETWVRYHHYLASVKNWNDIKANSPPRPQPELIKDGYAYNAGQNGGARDADVDGTEWVGDLALECDLTVTDATGEAILELVEGDRRFQCHFDLATGKATLSAEDIEDYQPTTSTKVRGPGTYTVRFANVDHQLLLWVNDSVIEFDQTTAYELDQRPRPGQLDLAPAGVGARGAKLGVAHLRVWRDVYYLADRFRHTRGPEDLSDHDDGENFDLGPDHFFALGDNSPRSKDSRLWNGRDDAGNTEHYVDRKFLTGKAMFIYWPHALDRIPGTDIWLPFVPNIERMRFVH